VRFAPAGLPKASNRTRVLMHVSNFRALKRAEDVVRIFAAVRSHGPTRLDFVGEGPERSSAEALVTSLGLGGHVRFLGEPADLPALLQASDVFLLPSQSESFGLAALEAMACGVPVVASDVGGIPEVVVDGVSGFLAPVGDVDGMAARHRAELAKERERLAVPPAADSVAKLAARYRSPALGEITEIHSWTNRALWPQGFERPAGEDPVPSNLNWDLWLGPAPYRPYHRAYHPTTWRCWWDFGCGMMGDRGAHTLDVVNWSLKLGAPATVEATSCGADAEVHPLSAIVTFRFPARENLPPVKLTWYEGTRPPRPEEMDADVAWPVEGGTLFKGSKGMLICGVYGNSPKLLPLSRHLDYKRPPKTLPRIADHCHELDWVRAIKTGGQAGASFGYSGPLTETCLLGNVAKRVDGPIEWDAANLKVKNSEAADRLVRTQYREGWSL